MCSELIIPREYHSFFKELSISGKENTVDVVIPGPSNEESIGIGSVKVHAKSKARERAKKRIKLQPPTLETSRMVTRRIVADDTAESRPGPDLLWWRPWFLKIKT